MVVLDATIVNVALASIQSDLGFRSSELTWIVNAYLIAFGSFLLVAGRLGDLIGTKPVFLAGIALFGVASALCGLAPSPLMLIAARFLQGIGAAFAASVIFAIIVSEFPAELRTRAVGILAFLGAGGAVTGLLAGGLITELLSWHWIFLVNVPLAAAAIAGGALLIKGKEGLGLRRGVDVLGSILVTSGMVLLVYTVVGTERHGWGSWQTLLPGAVALGLLVGFVLWERRALTPMLPLALLRSRNTAGTNLTRTFFVPATFSVFFFGPLYFERVVGHSPFETGLAFLPMTVAMAAATLFSPRLIGRFGAKRVVIAGLVIDFVGLVIFSRVPVDPSYFAVQAPALALLGAGIGVAFVPLVNLAMADAPENYVGMASGLLNSTQQMALAMGTAILGTLAASRSASLVKEGTAAADALASGYRLAFSLAAIGILVGIAFAALILREPEQQQRGATPEELAARGELLSDELI